MQQYPNSFCQSQGSLKRYKNKSERRCGYIMCVGVTCVAIKILFFQEQKSLISYILARYLKTLEAGRSIFIFLHQKLKALSRMQANFWQTNEAISIRSSMSYWRKKIAGGDHSENALLKFNHYSAKHEAYRNKKAVIEPTVHQQEVVWKPPPLSWD